MGAALCVPTARFEDWPRDLAYLRDAGYRVVALDPSPDAREMGPDTGARLGERVALLLGTEGVGLSAEARCAVDERLRIPMAPGFDSLNVATAGAVALQHLYAGTPGRG
jgi:tRNA G18 (ribose-2'-O)-methylase SpoU